MIITTRPNLTDEQLDDLREQVEARGLRTHIAHRGSRSTIACLGDVPDCLASTFSQLDGVASVAPVRAPYRLAAREFSPARTVVRVGHDSSAALGGRALAIIAGPCSVEGQEMLRETALAIRAAGAGLLRGGAFKPRSSPYAFQGLGLEALRFLADVRRETGMPVVTEVLDPRHVDLVAEHADVLQVGARNMQNFPLLAELGRIRRPVLLKRGFSATITELLLAAEYVLSHGNSDVILCERGIRTFEQATRNTLDIAAIPVLRQETHLPVIVDPSHAAGRADLVPALAFAAIAAGADGLIVEVHPTPAAAWSDGDQSLSLEEFAAMMRDLRGFAAAAGRTLGRTPAVRELDGAA